VPGFWAWRKSVPDYFWVPGTWVQPPQPGLLWTPPYWSRVDGGYAFHGGYWAAEVGFYGGINFRQTTARRHTPRCPRSSGRPPPLRPCISHRWDSETAVTHNSTSVWLLCRPPRGTEGELHCKLGHAVPIEPGLRPQPRENGNISNIGRRLSGIRATNGQIWSLETGYQFAKARHWRPFLRVFAGRLLARHCLAGVRGFELTHSRSNPVSGWGLVEFGNIGQATFDLDAKPGPYPQRRAERKVLPGSRGSGKAGPSLPAVQREDSAAICRT